ncbi:MAG: penicillin-binding protein 2 [Bauldia sp.]
MIEGTKPWIGQSSATVAGLPAPPSFPRDRMRPRLYLVLVAFFGLYAAIAGRLTVLAMTDPPVVAARGSTVTAARPDIVDRNGEVLATDIKSASLFAEPRRILDVDEAAELISGVLPGLEVAALRKKLAGNAGFAWIKREVTPAQRAQLHELGIPGLGFVTENRRFYPGGPTSSHLLGAVNVDNQGIAGIEKFVDAGGLADLQSTGFARADGLQPVRLSVDLRVQNVLRSELSAAMQRYQAIAATGVILDVHTGEVMAMVSLPDFDPNTPAEALLPDRLDRMAAGVFEMGSVFKTFTVAMALDAGKATLASTYDASHALEIGRFSIDDFHGKHRVLTLPEVFIYSSNIGAAKMALSVGTEGHQEFLRRIGLTKPVRTELPEAGAPLLPQQWSELSTMTIAFGHGISVTPLHTAVAAAALVNGGTLIPPTFLPRDRATAEKLGTRVVKPSTSAAMRYLFRLNVEKGSGTRAEAPGYLVGGKTGTAEKIDNGKYSSEKRFNSFLAAFPMDDPRFVVLVVLDEPKAEKAGASATASVNAAPTVASIVRRAAPMLGVLPRPTAKDGPLVAAR